MANGAEIIRENLWHTLTAFARAAQGLFGALTRKKPLRVDVDDETRLAIEKVAVQNGQSLEAVAAEWLASQAIEYKKARETKEKWELLSEREKTVAALSCLGYSDQEIATELTIGFGTARTHLYNAIYKFGIKQKGELHFLLRHWDFSYFDRDYSIDRNDSE